MIGFDISFWIAERQVRLSLHGPDSIGKIIHFEFCGRRRMRDWQLHFSPVSRRFEVWTQGSVKP